jgi:2,4-dienoyl-CoA reductase-like NADH-dependent reductase (Old Yellow Enzyme family)
LNKGDPHGGAAMESIMPSLFDPLKVGELHVPNRIFMAPLTAAAPASNAYPIA